MTIPAARGSCRKHPIPIGLVSTASLYLPLLQGSNNDKSLHGINNVLCDIGLGREPVWFSASHDHPSSFVAPGPSFLVGRVSRMHTKVLSTSSWIRVPETHE